ncbi:SCP2 sterol-binding domain-containing protein [Micromonospora purpureochromogenes]|uniref:Sterol carrier protein n=1 Tax=Micromonospora purpureochromogenes TaxID=47872 RepID=A0ABX2RNP0_9ACTN|nr:SCP2 sterol-binding domain-containing protein [Micromonospora purpureochromogenes]NYF58142.1 putative sterol carrier protein [Micromonospora purpureochromogenes]
MATSGAEFLERLSSRRRPHLPETLSGTIRLDLHDGGRTEHWYLTVYDQGVDVTRSPDDADLVVRADREVFDRLADGRTEVVQSLMRNEVTVQGEMRLLLALRRIFPGPADARHPRDVARESLGR